MIRSGIRHHFAAAVLLFGIAAALTFPAVRYVQVLSLRQIDSWISSVEEHIGLDIRFSSGGGNIFRRAELQDLRISTRDGEEVVRAGSLSLKYNLAALLLTPQDSHLIEIEARNVEASLTEQLLSDFSSRLRGLSDETTQNDGFFAVRLRRLVSAAAENLQIRAWVKDGNLTYNSVQGLAAAAGIDAEGTWSSTGTFSASGSIDRASGILQPVEADFQEMTFSVFHTETGFSISAGMVRGGGLISSESGGDFRLAVEEASAAVEADAGMKNLLNASVTAGSAGVSGEIFGQELSFETDTAELQLERMAEVDRYAVTVSAGGAEVFGNTGSDVTLLLLDEPQLSLRTSSEFSVELSSLIWNSGAVHAHVPLSYFPEAAGSDRTEAVTLHVPRLSGEAFRNPSKGTLNFLLESGQTSVSYSAPEIQRFQAEGWADESTLLIEIEGEQLLDASFLTEELKLSFASDTMTAESLLQELQIYVLNDQDRVSARLSAGVQSLVTQASTSRQYSAGHSLVLDIIYDDAVRMIQADAALKAVESSIPLALPDMSVSLASDSSLERIEAELTAGNASFSALYDSQGLSAEGRILLDDQKLAEFLTAAESITDSSRVPDVVREFIEPLRADGTLTASLLQSRDPDLTFSADLLISGASSGAVTLEEPVRVTLSGDRDRIHVEQISSLYGDYRITADGLFFPSTLAYELNLAAETETGKVPGKVRLMASGEHPLSGSFTLETGVLSGLVIESSYEAAGDSAQVFFAGLAQVEGQRYPFELSVDAAAFEAAGFLDFGSDGTAKFTAVLPQQTLAGISSARGTFSFEEFRIPAFIVEMENSPVLQAQGSFALQDESFQADIAAARISGLFIGERPLVLDIASASATPQSIRIASLTLDDGVKPLSGSASAVYRFSGGKLSGGSAEASLYNADEQYSVSVTADDQLLTVTADLRSADLRRLPGSIGSGYAGGFLRFEGTREQFSISSELRVEEGMIADLSYSGRMKIAADERELIIENFSGSFLKNSIEELRLSYEYATGYIESVSRQSFRTRNGTVSFALDVNAEIAPLSSLSDISSWDPLSQEISAEAMISSIVSNDIPLLDQFPVSLRYSGGEVTASAGVTQEIAVKLSSDGTIFASVGQKEDSALPVSLSFSGKFSDGEVTIASNDLRFSLPYLNSVIKFTDFLYFEEGDVYGSLVITGPLSDPDFYGELSMDYVAVSSGVLRETATARNISAALSEKSLYLNPFYSQVGNSYVLVDITIDMEYVVPYYYNVNFSIPQDNTVFFTHAIKNIGLEYEGMISGDISLGGAGEDMLISGAIAMEHAVISMLPGGRQEEDKKPVSADLILKTGYNVSAVFPNRDFPVIRATVAENQELNVSYAAGTKNYSVTGSFEILGGELFYFQRSFFITSGRFNFNEDHLSGFDPQISLSAKLRDFDRAGEKVDIILDVPNSALSNLSPILSSRPVKSINEIAEILGQNILPSAYFSGTNLSSALALAALAGDVFQRLGVIELDPISDLENSIRDGLQLDLFSVRTQVFQNIIMDTLTPSELQLLSINPIARYLDNTSIFLGKYMDNDIFFQAMFHLSANDRYGSGLFMTDDLRLDVELSLEWENPLYFLRISTQPAGLQPYQMLDALTLGISKNISL